MIEIEENIWNYPARFRCITTNGIVQDNGKLVMGKGIALEAKNKFPGIDERLGKCVKIFGNKPFFFNNIGIISFPTKHHYKDNSDLELIRNSAKHIASFAHIHGIKSITLPRVGCTNGNLQWENVKPILEPFFNSDVFVVCHKK